MAKKKPAEQWYSGDWFRAVDVRKCTFAVRGLWREMLDIMVNEQEPGKIAGSPDEICRLIGCKPDELDGFIRANQAHKFADVTIRNGKVTIINRRLHRAFIERMQIKKRVQRHRQKQKRQCNEDVTPYSSTSTSINNINSVTEAQQQTQYFEEARKLYPGIKRGLETEFENFKKHHHKDWKDVLSLLLPAIQRQIAYRQSRANIKGEFIPPWKHFKTWINNRCWEETSGKIESPEEKAVREKKELQKYQDKIRDEDGQYLRERTVDELQAQLKNPKATYRHWLIKEIIEEKLKEKHDERT